MTAQRARRGAAWIAAVGSAAVIAGLGACASPDTRTATATATATAPALATTPVASVTASPTTKPTAEPTAEPTAKPTATPAAAQHGPCPPLPPGGLKPNPNLPPPPPGPPGSIVTHPPPVLGCAYIEGFADVRKLYGAALVGPGLTNLEIGDRVVLNLSKNYFQEDSVGQFDYRPPHSSTFLHELPPATATFLAFGFTPVTATLQLTEIGTINIYGVGTTSTLTFNTAWALLSLRVYDVKVNGEPLNVGNDCRTDPLRIQLTGLSSSNPPYSLQGGGPLTGEIFVPAFHHCGVTENLDPLFTGTVSGPGNFVKFTQGVLCTPIGDVGCPPVPPKPLR